MADETTATAETQPQDQPQTTEQLLQQLLDEQREHRAEVAALRDEVNKSRTNPVPRPAPSVALSAEELQQQRADEIAEHDFYCPGCGRLFDRERECQGRPEAPHAPIEVVSTDELKGDDTSKHTVAPDTP